MLNTGGLTHPFTIGQGVMPAHIHDRMITQCFGKFSVPVRRPTVISFLYKLLIAEVGYEILANLKIFYGNRMAIIPLSNQGYTGWNFNELSRILIVRLIRFLTEWGVR